MKEPVLTLSDVVVSRIKRHRRQFLDQNRAKMCRLCRFFPGVLLVSFFNVNAVIVRDIKCLFTQQAKGCAQDCNELSVVAFDVLSVEPRQ